MWNDAVITNGGKELLAQWLDGGTFNLDSAATGEGTVAASLLMGQTKLVSKKQAMSIIRMEKVESGVRLQLQLISEGVTSGYTANQIGIWASLAGGGSRLIAIFQDNAGIRVPTFAEMPDYVFTFYAMLQMSNEGELTVTVDTSAHVTHRDLLAEETARKDADTAEAKARRDADTALQNDVTAEVKARGDAITAEAKARGDADTAEAKTRGDADTALQNAITAETKARGDADTAEAKTRGDADTALQNAITAETKARGDADTELQKNLDTHKSDANNPHKVTQKQLMDPLSAATDMADEDLLPFANASTGEAKKISKANLRAALGITAISIANATITLGTALTYTGAQQTQAVSSVVVSGQTLTVGTDYVVSGNTGTLAGNYTLVVTGVGKYAGSKAVTWSIAKANGSVSLNPSSLSIAGPKNTTKTVAVTRAGDGIVVASSSAPEVAVVTVNDTTINVKSVSAGTATIFVSVDAGSNHKAASITFNATVAIISSTLNDNSWDLIRQVSDSGAGASYWPVGATKEVNINGTVGTLSIDQKLWAFILGFNHNSAREGDNKIHFQGFKTAQTEGTDVGLIDSVYGSGYTDGTKRFNQNHWGNYNYGGWAAADSRYDVLGSTNVAPSNYGAAKAVGATGYDATNTCATNPVSGTLMAALPSDLRAVMKPITKYSDNVAGATNVVGNVTATVDYLPLLAEFEIFGTRTYANSFEQNYQAQYAYYQNGNSKIKYQHSAQGTAAVWFARSPYYNNNYTFCAVAAGGTATSYCASYSRALAPAFAV